MFQIKIQNTSSATASCAPSVHEADERARDLWSRFFRNSIFWHCWHRKKNFYQRKRSQKIDGVATCVARISPSCWKLTSQMEKSVSWQYLRSAQYRASCKQAAMPVLDSWYRAEGWHDTGIVHPQSRDKFSANNRLLSNSSTEPVHISVLAWYRCLVPRQY